MKQIKEIKEMIGKTIKLVEYIQDRSPTMLITFVDGDTVTLQVGGSAGYGEYLEITTTDS